jgi:hypothetical protein
MRRTKKAFLMGRIAENMELTLIFQLVNMYIRFKIWNYKLAGILPRKSMIVHETENLLLVIVTHKKFGQNWPTHESLHKIHLGRACQPVSHHFYGICFVT